MVGKSEGIQEKTHCNKYRLQITLQLIYQEEDF